MGETTIGGGKRFPVRGNQRVAEPPPRRHRDLLAQYRADGEFVRVGGTGRA